MMSSTVGRIIVTGAGGFIGRRLCEVLRGRGEDVLALSRHSAPSVGEINGRTDWSTVLHADATVIHLAARAHVLERDGAQDLDAFREVNVEGTRRLGFAASSAGVRRLVYVSSIGVLGTATTGRAAFSDKDSPQPSDPYARSKWEAEQALQDVAAQTGLEVSVVRPPLVYGPNAPGNFGRLLSLVLRGVPLPLGAVQNRRSLVALDNLVDLVSLCIVHPAAAGGTFLVADRRAVSTPDLIRGIAQAMNRRALLLPVPVEVLRFTGRALGKSAEVERLVGSLEVDISHTCDTLGWTPPIDMQEGLRRVVQC